MARIKTTKTRTRTGGIKGIGALSKIPADQIENLHKNVFDVVKKNLPRVAEVLAGTRKWDNIQAKLYLSMLNKVMPEISASQTETEVVENVDEMTQEQLQQFIARELSKSLSVSGPTPPLPPPTIDLPINTNTNVFALSTVDGATAPSTDQVPLQKGIPHDPINE